MGKATVCRCRLGCRCRTRCRAQRTAQRFQGAGARPVREYCGRLSLGVSKQVQYRWLQVSSPGTLVLLVLW